MLESLVKITETSPKARVNMSDQPIEAVVDAQSEVESGSYLVEEGNVGPKEEAPLPLQGSTKLSL